MSASISIKALEQSEQGTELELEQLLAQIPFNAQGLIPAIAQDTKSNAVLMLGWMDATAIRRTVAEQFVCYFSRSRQTYWRKGETSGNLQKVASALF